MGSLRLSRCCLAALLVALLMCQAFVQPAVARSLVEKKHVVTAQTSGSQKSVSTQSWWGWGPGNGSGSGGGGGGGGGGSSGGGGGGGGGGGRH